jgi:hypothetical protein
MVDATNLILAVFVSLVVGMVVGIAVEKWIYRDAGASIYRIYRR